MYSIGEFSKITGLTVKTLRFYHEEGVLTPSCIDDQTGYRYYGPEKIETARIISQLRTLDFSIAEIAHIVRDVQDDADLLEHLERHKRDIAAQVRRLRDVEKTLDRILASEREALAMTKNADFQIEEKMLSPVLIAGVRLKAKYSECGRGFGMIGKQFGRQICGPCFLLHYDMDYREDDADFEACMPIRQGSSIGEINVRELPGGRCVSLLHKGPYDQLGRSYARILEYVKQKNYEIESPTREVYLKGPGMIFRGNPKKYLTEIQMVIRSEAMPE
jgi:DNA-binding transcriptional MerR regulator/effector-binding domain-containing protein